MLWSPADISSVLKTKIPDNVRGACSVAIDTRTILPGEIFIGITGQNFQGSNFMMEALDKGASLCLVEYPLPELLENQWDRVIVVEDAYRALTELAMFSRDRFQGRVCAITGSAGKTTAKEMLKMALSSSNVLVHATPGNKNNMFGVPISLCALQKDFDYAVLELGMSAKGEIAALSQLTRPHVGVITNVGAAHTEKFGSVEDIAMAKAEICEGMTRDSNIILNAGNEYTDILTKHAEERNLRPVFFGRVGDSLIPSSRLDVALISSREVMGVDGECDGLGMSTEVVADCFGQRVAYKLGVVGEHFVYNSLAVLGAVGILGGDIRESLVGLGKFRALEGRGKIYALKNGIVLIDESYNANILSMRSAIKRLKDYRHELRHTDQGGEIYIRRLVAILGDMKGLGKDSSNVHSSLIPSILDAEIDAIFFTGEFMRELSRQLPNNLRVYTAEDEKFLTNQVLQFLEPGDLVLIKGSLSMNMGYVRDALLKFWVYD